MSKDYTDIGFDSKLRREGGIAARVWETKDSAALSTDIGGGAISARNIGFNYNEATYGYAENFDATFDFVLPFYIDPGVVKIQKVMLNLLFSKYRGFTKTSAGESSHTHSVTIPSHSHTVQGTTTASGSTSVTTQTTDTSGQTAHEHAYQVYGTDNAGGTTNYGPVRVELVSADHGRFYLDQSIGPDAYIWVTTNTTETGHSHNVTINDPGHSHSVSIPTTDAGGGTVIASATGSEHSHAMTYGINEDTYASNVSVSVISAGGTADVTTAIGGPFNPSAGTPNFYDMDITKYVKGNGLSQIVVSSDTNGRVFPLLWVKTVIGG